MCECYLYRIRRSVLTDDERSLLRCPFRRRRLPRLALRQPPRYPAARPTARPGTAGPLRLAVRSCAAVIAISCSLGADRAPSGSAFCSLGADFGLSAAVLIVEHECIDWLRPIERLSNSKRARAREEERVRERERSEKKRERESQSVREPESQRARMTERQRARETERPRARERDRHRRCIPHLHLAVKSSVLYMYTL